MIIDNGRELADTPKNRRTVLLNQTLREVVANPEGGVWKDLAVARKMTLHGLVGERLPEVVEQYLPGDLDDYSWKEIAEALRRAIEENPRDG